MSNGSIVDNYVDSRCYSIALKHDVDCAMVHDLYGVLCARSPLLSWPIETAWEFLDEQVAKVKSTLGKKANDVWAEYGPERLMNIVETMESIKAKDGKVTWKEAYEAFSKDIEEARKDDPICTGYIPVEYNLYKELVRKAEAWDRISSIKKWKGE